MGSSQLSLHQLHLTMGGGMSNYYITSSRRLNDGLHSLYNETTTGPGSPPPRY